MRCCPSEAVLAKEFGASRSTVVRALEFLRQQGWVDAQQGKGRTVLGPPSPPRSMPERVQAILTVGEQTAGVLLTAGQVAAFGLIASALLVPEGAAVVARRLLVRADARPVELRTVYVPTGVAAATGLAGSTPLPDGLLAHLVRRGMAVPYHVVERISARQPTAQEAAVLEIGRRDCLLTALWSVRDRAGRALLAIDAAFPASRRALEDCFPAG